MKFIRNVLLFFMYIGINSQLSAITTITVTSTADTAAPFPDISPEVSPGVVTLRSAVQFSQGLSGDPVMNIIQFDIAITDLGFQPSTDSWLIQPTATMGSGAAYLIDTNPVTVNAYAANTAFPASANSNVFEDGSNAVLRIEIRGPGAATPGIAFRVTGIAGCVFKGLCINSFLGDFGATVTGAGIRLDNGDNGVISGNFLGVDITGTTVNDPSSGDFLGNLRCLRISGNNISVGGINPADSNVIATSIGDTGCIEMSTDTVDNFLITRNYIGTDKTGQKALHFSTHGILFEYVAGNGIIDNNVISVEQIGIWAIPIDSISHNKIGTNVKGTVALGSSAVGIFSDTQVAGTQLSLQPLVHDNTISGKAKGIQVGRNSYQSTPTLSVHIQGNKIGTDSTGSEVLGNRLSGVFVQFANETQVGIDPSSPDAAQRNIISGNKEDGVRVTELAVDTLIKGNIIGADISGVFAKDSNGNSFGNKLSGVRIGINQGETTSPTTVGGTTPLETNYIVNNGKDGITIQSFSDGNIVEGNSLGVGIGNKELGNQANGVTIICSSGNQIGS